jgi:hypothetical protein
MGPLSIEENDDVRGGIAQGPDPIGKAGPEQVGIEPVDHVVERVMGLQATLIGQSAAGNWVVVRPVARSSAESSMPKVVAQRTSNRISGREQRTRQRSRGSASAEKSSRTEADGRDRDTGSPESPKRSMNHFLSASPHTFDLKRLPSKAAGKALATFTEPCSLERCPSTNGRRA